MPELNGLEYFIIKEKLVFVSSILRVSLGRNLFFYNSIPILYDD